MKQHKEEEEEQLQDSSTDSSSFSSYTSSKEINHNGEDALYLDDEELIYLGHDNNDYEYVGVLENEICNIHTDEYDLIFS